MFRRHPAWVAWMAVSFVVLGCCGHGLFEPTPLEKNWGKSLERAKVSQELNTEAPENLNPVTGLDGQAAENAMKRYRESQGPQGNTSGSGTGMNPILGTLGYTTGQ